MRAGLDTPLLIAQRIGLDEDTPYRIVTCTPSIHLPASEQVTTIGALEGVDGIELTVVDRITVTVEILSPKFDHLKCPISSRDE